MEKILQGLKNAVSHKLIPWAETDRTAFLVMPYAGRDLPPDVEITKKPICGPCHRVKNRRPANQISSVTALWPEAGLCAKAEPFLVWVLAGRAQMQIGSQWLSCGESTAIYCSNWVV